MQEYHFNVEAARLYGVDEAIFLHSLAFWIAKNRANKKHLHDGRYWSYNTQAALAELFPFWSRRQIERIIASCKEQGALLTGYFNTDKTDRTTWYTLTDDAQRFYNITETVECIAPSGAMDAPQGVGGGGVAAPPIAPNGDMHCTEPWDGCHETVECNKETVTYTDKIPPKAPRGGRRRKEPKQAPDWKPERFARFWDFYSHHARGENKQAAIRAWDKLRPDDELIETMGLALKAQIASEAWRQGIGIPYASTWLNNSRWEDVPKAAASAEPTGGWAADPEVV